VLALPVGKSVIRVGNGGADAGASTEDGKVRAHPIMGWKGFEDVVGLLPGETVDEVGDGDGEPCMCTCSLSVPGSGIAERLMMMIAPMPDFAAGCWMALLACTGQA